jgi:putative transposase
MVKTEHLLPGAYFHIYNCGIDKCDLFREHENYIYFIKLYEKYIDPIADTYSWVLMKNHFHFLVRIHDLPDLPGLNLEGLKPPYQHFSNLFNAYTKAFNKRYERTGSLFQKNFHRKKIEDGQYLKNVITYIHQNPVHHGFCFRPGDYPWSSYNTMVSIKQTKLQRDAVVGWFDNLGNFLKLQETMVETEKIEKWLKI